MRIKFLNTHVDNLTMDEAIGEIDKLICEKKNSYVVTPNLDHIILIENDIIFKEIYDHADLVLTDGMPLLWISKRIGMPIKEKVSGSDLFPELCCLAARKGYSMFFLGAEEGVAAIAAEKLKRRFQGLNIVGTYSPPFGFEKDESEIEKIIKMIQTAKPHILIAALGTPKQEKFIAKYREELGVPVSLGLGATLDFEAGKIKRAPKWMTERGLEWLYRITQDPKRLIIRYWNDAINILPIIKKYNKMEQ